MQGGCAAAEPRLVARRPFGRQADGGGPQAAAPSLQRHRPRRRESGSVDCFGRRRPSSPSRTSRKCSGNLSCLRPGGDGRSSPPWHFQCSQTKEGTKVETTSASRLRSKVTRPQFSQTSRARRCPGSTSTRSATSTYWREPMPVVRRSGKVHRVRRLPSRPSARAPRSATGFAWRRHRRTGRRCPHDRRERSGETDAAVVPRLPGCSKSSCRTGLPEHEQARDRGRRRLTASGAPAAP